MSNGPPTPPPTTEREISDQEKAQVPSTSVPPAEVLPQPEIIPQQLRQNAYQTLLPTLIDLAAQRNYEELVRVAEEADVNTIYDRHPSRLLLTVPLVLSYLILDRLPPARYALERLPARELATHPLCGLLRRLLASVWERDYIKIYPRAEEVYELVSRTGFPDQDLVPITKTLTTVFIETFRRRTFVLLSKAYTSLSVSQAQIYLGLAVEPLLVVTEANQWSYDPPTNILIPKPVRSPNQKDAIAPSSISFFHTVADGVVGLEL